MSTSRARRLGSLALLLLPLSFICCSKADQGETSSAEQSAAEPVSKSAEAPEAQDPEPFPGAVEGEKERQQTTPSMDAQAEPLDESIDAPAAAPVGGAAGAGRGAVDLGKSRDDAPRKKKKRKAKGASKKAPAPKASGAAASVPKQERPQEEAERAIADPERLMSSLASLEGQLRSAGIRLPQDSGSDKDLEPNRDYDCKKVCQLQGAICGLQERICDLAAAHPEDDRYARACERATGDCRVAKDACSACE